MKVQYYILSKLHKHALAVINESEKKITIQKLKIASTFDQFTNDIKKVIVADGEATVAEKDGLSNVFADVEITKEYWTVYEYLTGIKRKSVAINTEN